jgi:hypothetical protein
MSENMAENMKPKGTASQQKRFEQAARDLGVDLDEEKLREALRKTAVDRARGKDHIDKESRKTRDEGDRE